MVDDPPDPPPHFEYDPNVIPMHKTNGAGGTRGPKGAVKAFHFADDTSGRSHIEWLIKTILPTQGVAMLGGITSTGKTYVALDMAMSIVLGDEWCGHRTKHPGGVLWFAAEGAFNLQPRWRAIRDAKAAPFLEHRGIEPSLHLPFIYVEDCPKLTDFAGANSYISTAQAVMERLELDDVKLRLIVIDTFSASTTFQDANSAAEAQKAIDALKRLNVATGAMVLAIDHFGKNAEAGLRGSSAKEAGIDVLLQINGERGQTEGLEFEVAKVRGGMVGFKQPFSLTLVDQGVDEDGDPVTERIVKWGGERKATVATAKQPKSLQMLTRAICDLEPDHRTNPRDDIWVRAVDESKLRAEYYKKYTASADEDQHRNAKSSSFKRAIEAGLFARVIDKLEYPDGRSLVWMVSHVKRGAEAAE